MNKKNMLKVCAIALAIVAILSILLGCAVIYRCAKLVTFEGEVVCGLLQNQEVTSDGLFKITVDGITYRVKPENVIFADFSTKEEAQEFIDKWKSENK